MPEPAGAERFHPSTHGFAFTNGWPSQPAVRLRALRIGNARNAGTVQSRISRNRF